MRKKFYHWAPKGCLSKNQILENISILETHEYQEFKLYANRLGDNFSNQSEFYLLNKFPHGLNPRGLNCMFAKRNVDDVLKELYLEQARLAVNEKLPSRLSCFYAFDSIDTAREYKKESLDDDGKEYELFEIECGQNSYFRFDQKIADLLKQGLFGELYTIKDKFGNVIDILRRETHYIATCSLLAEAYWKQGSISEIFPQVEGRWEYLIEFPVKIIAKIEDTNLKERRET
ncbi:DUF2441 domain-containing protein [Turicibacter sanguinis]|uniref:DUF2441 domain-containing protein n=1 Tax=Turicibacter sanguinis TaxID=154288 RepID=UPI0018A8EA7C|nr:DUF2441 domain-containing protein [Turicibacter sanguinis]MDB8553021.1 DUF2441 domain-containing protein [Turicibacter sanguinis]